MKAKVKPILVESKEDYGITLGINITKNIPGAMRGQHYQLILISLNYDEKIEIGDKFKWHVLPINETWITTITQELIDEYTDDGLSFLCNQGSKVIATQDQIPIEYIQQFVEEYNKGEIKDVEIEMTTPTYEDWIKNGASPVYPKPKFKMGFITIVNKEPILYTEEEVKELCYKAMRYKGYTEYNECMEWFETIK